MDSNVTVRFYRVDPKDAEQPAFGDCLSAMLKRPEEDLFVAVDGISVQVERFARDGDFIVGDLVRSQHENFPSLVKRGKKSEKLVLPDSGGLGHHAAFMFDPATHVIGYQMTRNAVSLTRFNSLVSHVCQCSPFNFLPILNRAELKAIGSMSARTLRFKIADPHGLEALESEEQGLRDNLINLKEFSNGVYLKVTIGIGRAKGELEQSAIVRMITWLMGQREKKHGKIQELALEGKQAASLEDMELDFLKGRLEETKAIQLTDIGPDESFKARINFIRTSLMAHREYMRGFVR